MQFKVPQFLDIEDKIFGPFTFSEFSYLVGGAGLCFVLYKMLGLLLGIIPMLIIAAFSLALVFFHPNDKPFVNMLEASIGYLIQDKLYIWKKKKVKKGTEQEKNKKEQQTQMEELSNIQNGKLTGSKLRDLAWSLDVLDIKKEERPN